MYSCSIFIVCLLAISLSGYSVYVKKQAHQDENYRALCDVNAKVSCTKVFTSEFGIGFGLKMIPEEIKLPNGIYGLGFYSLMAVLSKSLWHESERKSPITESLPDKVSSNAPTL